MGRRIEAAEGHHGANNFTGLLHEVLLQEFLTIWIIIHLLRLPRGGRGILGRRRGFLFLLLCLSLFLMLQLFLFLRTQLIFIACLCSPIACPTSSLGVSIRLVASGHTIHTSDFGVVEFKIDLDCVLGGAAVEFVRVEPLLHPQHRHIRLQRGFPQAIIVEVKLILRDVAEMLEGLVELFQGFAILLLPVVAPPHGRFVPHALHVVKVSRLMRVWLLAKEQGLLHATLRIIHSQHRPHTLRVEVSIRQVHFSHLLIALGRFLKIASVFEDPRLAGVELHQGGRVSDGLIHVLQGLVGLAHKVEVLRQSHQGEQQGGGRLFIAHLRRLCSPSNRRSKPRNVLLQTFHVLQEQLLDQLGFFGREVVRADGPKQRRHAFAEPVPEVLVQLGLEELPSDEKQRKPLQRVGLGELFPKLLEEFHNSFLLLVVQGHLCLEGVNPSLVLLPADDQPPLRLQGVPGRQPAEDGHTLRMQSVGKGEHRLGNSRRVLLAILRRWQRRPETRKLGLRGHVCKGVDLMFWVDLHQLLELLLGFLMSSQEHRNTALGLPKAELVDDLRLVLLQAG
mmetsp:Transcript_26929/g.58844  ORF Transcript_26929/g.58844 Transcript_26929/m.58844 type:complete len:562 (+) Transcript_26929:609-2294(+)